MRDGRVTEMNESYSVSMFFYPLKGNSADTVLKGKAATELHHGRCRI